ncbi:MAG TPA: tryptophan-rich sensory protein [Saprospiraceae bacterium]|nr:tryptophan-rich sensory protein [Saprospiraceae bacterium]HPI04842.1 tryptophan-rich sensory protein [Saprospiraceae bacterium]
MTQAVSNISSFWKWVIAVVICEAAGIVSALISMTAMNPWFDTLNKPSWNPPAYLFGPVWTFLYVLMGTALWLIWKSDAPEKEKKSAEIVFAIQLFLNFWWSIIFFRYHELALAFAEVILLLITIAITIFRFAPISRTAAWLMVPYISWVSFASMLNYTIWMMNK